MSLTDLLTELESTLPGGADVRYINGTIVLAGNDIRSLSPDECTALAQAIRFLPDIVGAVREGLAATALLEAQLEAAKGAPTVEAPTRDAAAREQPPEDEPYVDPMAGVIPNDPTGVK